MKKKTQLPISITPFILHFVQQSWLKFSFLAFCAIYFSINSTIFPYFIKRIINILETNTGDWSHIYLATSKVLLILLIIFAIAELLIYVQGVVRVYTYPNFRAKIREEVFNYTKSHSHEYLANQLAGNLAQKITNIPTSTEVVLEIVFSVFLSASIVMGLVLYMMWSIHPLLSVITFLWLLLHFIITLVFMYYGTLRWGKHAEAAAILSGRIVDVFTNITNIRLFAHDNYELEYLKSFQQDEVKKAQKAMWLMVNSRMLTGLNSLVLMLGMIFCLIYGRANGWISIGDVTQATMQMLLLLGVVWGTTLQFNIFIKEAGSIRDALHLLRKSHDVTDKQDATLLVVDKGEISLKDIQFSYHANKPIFSELNLIIPAKQKLGIVGFSGSGKTTLVNLILRFYDVKQGEILIDNYNIRDVTQDSLRSNIAVIPQDLALFNRSLMENIRYGCLTATDEDVIEAAKLAHCHEFIERLDEGYQTVAGERGAKLSGGQRQRIAIARAILKNAPILIIDEATSALDSSTEKLIHESMHYLMRGKTTLVIAHRLSTLKDMDRIIFLEKGQIIEDGTKEDLIKLGKNFAKLWEMQVNGFL